MLDKFELKKPLYDAMETLDKEIDEAKKELEQPYASSNRSNAGEEELEKRQVYLMNYIACLRKERKIWEDLCNKIA